MSSDPPAAPEGTYPSGAPSAAAAPPGTSAPSPAPLPPHPTSFVTSRPVAVLVVTAATVVFGWFSLKQLPVALMPELSYPTLTVRTEYPGAAPEEVENDISRPLEEALGVIGGLRRISSVSRAGISDVVLEFAWDTDMSEASQDTLEKLDLVFLPDEAERPLILRYDPSLDPVMELSLSGAGDRFAGEEGLRRLRRLADREIKRALEPIKGVAAVRVRGGLEEEILVALDEERLSRSGLSAEAVATRLAQENVNVAGGTIKEGRTEYMVRTLNEYEEISEIRDTVISSLGGREVRLRDVAEVSWSHEEQQILTRTDGGVSVEIDVFKEADANIVDLASRVKDRLGKLDLEAEAAREAGKPPAPRRRFGGGPGGEEPAGLATDLYRNEGASLAVVADRSLFIQSSIDEVKGSAIEGALLSVLVLLLFLRNPWTTLIVAVSIPVSLLISFAPMQLAGTSLNIMSLGGLALGVGMLVDASIVVIESIFRCREEGDDVVTAAERGIKEVRAAVISTVLTTIAVFFPMVFVEGIAGQAFGDLGLAVTVSLLASMVVAIYLVPMLASRRGITLPAGAGAGPPALERRSLLRFGSLAALRQDLASLGRWLRPAGEDGERRLRVLRLLALPPAGLYLLVRLVVGLPLEALAKLALGAALAALGLARGLYKLLRRAALAVARRVAALRQPGAAGGAEAGAGANPWLARLRGGYERAVRWAVEHPAAMVGVVVVMFALSIPIGSGLDSELLPEVHQGELTVEVALPVGTPLEETEAVLAPVERAILAEREHIRALILTLGFDPETSQRSDEGEHTARFKLLLDSSAPQVEEAVIDRVRRRLAAVPDTAVRVVRPVLFSFKTPIEVEIYGDELGRLKRTTDEVREVMASLPELADVESTLKTGAPEVEIVYDRDLLARYGLNIRQVALEIRNQVKGYEATRFNLKDRRIPVVVRLGKEDRETVADVAELVVNPGAERPIPLSAVAEVTLAEGPSEVRRIDGRRVAVVGANLAHGLGAQASLGAAVAAIERELSRRIDWPADMTFLVAGQNEEWERSRGSLVLALALSIFLVYVIMAAQFESLLQPLVILFTIPLALFGTVLTLKALALSLSIVVFLGAILLVGIVVDNAIVLVDYINVLRQRGYALEEAIVTAGTVRLRPILMTTLTTVLGLVPMALGLGDGAEIRRPMAIAVISGMVSSTALTLLIIPSLYALVERWKERLLGRRLGLAPAGSPAEVVAAPPTAAGEPAR